MCFADCRPLKQVKAAGKGNLLGVPASAWSGLGGSIPKAPQGASQANYSILWQPSGISLFLMMVHKDANCTTAMKLLGLFGAEMTSTIFPADFLSQRS